MGIKKWVKEFFRNRYRKAYLDEGEEPTDGNVLIVDFMQYMKYIPDEVKTLGDLLHFLMSHLKRKITSFKGRLQVIVICFDQKATDHECNLVKSICYQSRYKNTDFYPAEGAPYLPKRDDGQLPPEWNRFCGSSTLLRRELYPLIYNCCLDSRYVQLRFGQSLVLQGLPGRTMDDIPNMKQNHKQLFSAGVYDPKHEEAFASAMCQLVPWDRAWLPITPEMEQRDKDLYNRVYVIKAVPPNVDARFPKGFLQTYEWEDARNNMGEADLAMMFFDRFFPQNTQIIDINDGDIIPIALLYAQERLVGNAFRNNQYLALPIKEGNKKKNTEEKVIIVEPKKLAKFTYIDVNALYTKICNDPMFGMAGVQNHVMMVVFMIVLSETDFFRNSFGGIGVEKSVWKTLTEKLDIYHHIVQSTKNILPDPTLKRTVVLDDAAWKEFAYRCYMEKHGSAVRKKNKGKITKKLLQVHLSKRKRENEQLPSGATIQRWGRQVQYNIEYWLNGPRGLFPDPFETVDGKSFYGYEKDEATGEFRLAASVSAYRPVDEVYERFFLRNTRPQKRARKEVPTHEEMDNIERLV